MIIKLKNYFTRTELTLWISSIIFIVLSFILFDKENYLTLIASIVGATSLIFNAKGNPFGQLLMIIFSLMYGIISYSFSYYGEMITYLAMTAPMAFVALISWLKNPYKGKKSQVCINTITKNEIISMTVQTAIITVVFYYVLKYFNTTNLFLSTISVTTSYAAVYLTYKRSPYYAVGYALNDVILIILWTYASFTRLSYISVVICFITFLINDIYGFINWLKIKKMQNQV